MTHEKLLHVGRQARKAYLDRRFAAVGRVYKSDLHEAMLHAMAAMLRAATETVETEQDT